MPKPRVVASLELPEGRLVLMVVGGPPRPLGLPPFQVSIPALDPAYGARLAAAINDLSLRGDGDA